MSRGNTYIPTDGTQRKGWGSVPAPGRCWMPATRPSARLFAKASPPGGAGGAVPPLPASIRRIVYTKENVLGGPMAWGRPFVRLWFGSVLGIDFPLLGGVGYPTNPHTGKGALP